MTKASDYVFGVFLDEDGNLSMMITLKSFFDAEGYVDSVHIGEDIEPFWPKDLEMDEACESWFMFSEEVTAEEVIAKMIAAGFIHDPAFQTLMEEG